MFKSFVLLTLVQCAMAKTFEMNKPGGGGCWPDRCDVSRLGHGAIVNRKGAISRNQQRLHGWEKPVVSATARGRFAWKT